MKLFHLKYICILIEPSCSLKNQYSNNRIHVDTHKYKHLFLNLSQKQKLLTSSLHGLYRSLAFIILLLINLKNKIMHYTDTITQIISFSLKLISYQSKHVFTITSGSATLIINQWIFFLISTMNNLINSLTLSMWVWLLI